MLLTAIFIVLIAILMVLPVSFIGVASFMKDSPDLKLSVKLAHVITLFGWDSSEEGLDFLFKKRVDEDRKKKKKRLNAIIKKIFNPKSLLNIKGLSFIKFQVKGVLATRDAARTALLYGLLCCIISILGPFISDKKMVVDFYPDFQKNQSNFHISCIIRVRIYHIIYLIAEGFKDNYLKGRWHSLWNRILLKN